jgi:hypothetical protein
MGTQLKRRSYTCGRHVYTEQRDSRHRNVIPKGWHGRDRELRSTMAPSQYPVLSVIKHDNAYSTSYPDIWTLP